MKQQLINSAIMAILSMFPQRTHPPGYPYFNTGQLTAPIGAPITPETMPQPLAVSFQDGNLVAAKTNQTTPETLTISLENNTPSSTVYAYITGQTLDGGLFVLSASGNAAYTYASVNKPLTPIPPSDIAIPLNAPGSSSPRTVTIPRLAGARIWFSVDSQLEFFLNPVDGVPQDGKGAGLALVEPSVTNDKDVNYEKEWGFVEFTFNEFQLFANVSMVDLVGKCPASLGVIRTTGRAEDNQEVEGMGYETGLNKVVDELKQAGGDWEKLVVRRKSDGQVTRVMSPNSAVVMAAERKESFFSGYYDGYVKQVWEKYAKEDLMVDTQNKWGVVKGRVDPGTGLLTFKSNNSETITFDKPSAADIFSCSTGPFAFPPMPANATEAELDIQAFRGNVGARLAAALNRSTLLINNNQPAGEEISTFYKSNNITNHYSRVVHQNSPKGKGYAFPYDDVSRTEKENVAGTVAAGDPKVFIVAVGGGKVDFAAAKMASAANATGSAVNATVPVVRTRWRRVRAGVDAAGWRL
ncbi:glycoside hydrolase family 64 protein [Neurospora intermedia]|uniref:Glycoside hydrolase family 64 protein n=1 Tax=Neurospora intermedia TaxID=5142 RepID=A0ABR3DPD4_NEUIN